MDVTLKIILIFLLLVLSGCFRTVVPYTPQHAEYASYQVRSGDTLGSIAKHHKLDYKVLAQRNHLRPPYTIYVGQRLYLWRQAPKSTYLPMPKLRKKAHATIVKKKAKVSRKHAKSPSRAIHKGKVSLHWPLRGRISSKFGRRHGRPHDGIDIAAKEGTAVRAAAAGEVVYADHRLTGYGNLIIVRHSHDMFTAYAHNQRNLVHKGQRVKRGDMIARVGHTGRSSGSHLHFEVRRGPTPVNPLVYLPKR
ncbi:MAG: M23 family metallopeptidase [Mariprofundaceae bacterium]|nr:M23 family metallopeptidase [Mariprofundaceae bacterium]